MDLHVVSKAIICATHMAARAMESTEIDLSLVYTGAINGYHTGRRLKKNLVYWMTIRIYQPIKKCLILRNGLFGAHRVGTGPVGVGRSVEG